MGLQKALKKRGTSAKQSEAKTKKSKTHEEVVAKNSKVDKAITNFHKANELEANASIMKEEAIKELTNFGMTRMFERKSTQNITMEGSQGSVYIALKDQYTAKVNPETETCDELEAFLEGKGIEPDTIISYEEKATLNIKKMSEKEIGKLADFLAKTLGEEKMNEVLSFKTVPVINGLVDIIPSICETQEEIEKLREISKQHRPTINVPSKKGKK